MTTFLSNLEWRHATKSFDHTKSVSEADLAKVLHAIRMAPTSYGLQPFHVEVVKDKATREKLFPHAYSQKQIVTCTALIVFVAHTNLSQRIDKYFDALSGGNAEVRAKMKDYEGMMRGSVGRFSAEEAKTWAAKQAYIGLGFGLAACAELSIDSCAMEGFNGPEFDKILGLEQGYHSVVLLPVGHRDPSIPTKPKFRVDEKEFFKHR